jgi:penicillin-binding protein 2
MNRSSTLNNNVAPLRILALVIIISVIFGIYIIQLFNLQIIQGSDWSSEAEENRISEISLPTLRGVIFDRNGIILARNVPSYNAIILPAQLPDDPGEIQEIFRHLSRTLNMPINLGEITPETPYVPCRSEHGIAQIVFYGQTSAPYEPVKIKCNIDEITAMILKEKSMDWEGVDIEVESIRDYPTGSITSSIIGFLGPISAANQDYYRERGFVANRDKVGYAGIERSYETILSGKPGKRLIEVDVAGQIIRDIRPQIQPIPGQNLNLTIDTRFQQAAEAILISEIDSWNAYFRELRITSGVTIALNPQTGEILAMVSYPTYENNRMARVIPTYYYEQLLEDVRDPLLNHAVGAELPAGSVFKLSTAVGALNEEVVTPEQIIQTPGEIVITEKYSWTGTGQVLENSIFLVGLRIPAMSISINWAGVTKTRFQTA